MYITQHPPLPLTTTPPKHHPYVHSVPNSSYGLIFVKRRALFGQKYGRKTGAKSGKTQVLAILSSICDLVQAESVVDLFAKHLNNARERAKSQKYGR